MLVLFTLGLGMLIGAQVAGFVGKVNTPSEAVALNDEVQAIGAKIAAIDEETASHSAQGKQPPQELLSERENLGKQRDEKAMQALRLMNWRTIWMIPAVGAAVIMLLFAALFREERGTGTSISPGDVATAAAIEEQP